MGAYNEKRRKRKAAGKAKREGAKKARNETVKNFLKRRGSK